MDSSPSFETLAILTFLIPGFLSSAILDHAFFRPKRDLVPSLVEALIFSFTTYVAVAAVRGSSPVFLLTETIGAATRYSVRFDASAMGLLLALAIILPLAVAFCLNKDWTGAVLRGIGITQRTSRNSTWLDVFSQDRFVIVNFADGRRVYGWPMFYPNTRDGGLYLWRPSWLDGDNVITPDIHGLFLVQKDLIETIEFMHNTKDDGETNHNERTEERPASHDT